MKRYAFIPLILVFVIYMIGYVYAGVSNVGMTMIYQLTRSKYYPSDGNSLSYTVEWYYASGYVGGVIKHFYAGYVREIPDANNGNSDERWYVYRFGPKFTAPDILNLYDMDPVNPSGCVSSLSGGVSANVGVSPNGPSTTIGLSYSFTISPYKLSVNVPNTYPNARWIFETCSNQYGSAWKGETVIMYVTTSSSPLYITAKVGATYVKEVRQCIAWGYIF